MKIIKWLVIVIVALALIVLVWGALVPGVVKIESTAEVELPANKVFYGLATYQNRTAWDPWFSTDSTAEASFNLEEGYVGSTYQWNGEKIKTGTETIDSVSFGNYIGSSLDFHDGQKPSKAEWILASQGNTTLLTWSFSGEGAYPVGRIFLNLFKGGLQKSFDDGIAALKTQLESQGVKMHKLKDIAIVDMPEMKAMVAGYTGGMDSLTAVYTRLFTAVGTAIGKQGLAMAGAPFSYSYHYNPEAGITSMYIGMPVATKGRADGEVVPYTFKAFRALKASFFGPYEELTAGYNELMNYMKEQNLDASWTAFEFYVSDPMAVPDPMKVQTDIYLVLNN
jgi:effector-binding domain-containing protein